MIPYVLLAVGAGFTLKAVQMLMSKPEIDLVGEEE